MLPAVARGGSRLVKADFVNAFLNLVVQVWKDKLSIELSFREAEVVSGVFVTEDLTAAVSVTGKLEGHVFYEFPDATSLAIAHALDGSTKLTVDEDTYATIGTFAEALSADVAFALLRAGYGSEVTPPVLLAKGASVTVTRPQIWTHFDSEIGPLGVRVALAETAS